MFRSFNRFSRSCRHRYVHLQNKDEENKWTMVRRIRSCEACQSRYVALANALLCSSCCESSGVQSSSNSQSVFTRIDEVDRVASPCHETSERESMGSECGDEIQCTQLLTDDDDDDEPTSCVKSMEDQRSSHAILQKAEEASTGRKENPSSANADICFICGTSLSNLKRRLDHIKRCSKKYSITGRDVKVNSDLDTFECVPNNRNNRSVESTLNPYTRESSWHGDASLTLKLATGTETIPNSTSSSNQTLLTSFLNRPMQNINNVLLAGARRMTKAATILANTAQQANGPNQSFRGTKRRRGSFASRTYSSECPSYKKIPGTDFVCDGFHYAKSSLTQNYFLTHFHSDHYGGITASWNIGIIYCSLPTAELVAQQIGVNRKYLHPLPMNTPTIVASRGKPVEVTLLDANHCPGAVMFLFRVGKRCILHVGDFRWNREVMLVPGSTLKQFVSGDMTLDELFLDTTYCNPRYSLPSQAETITAIQALFEKELDRCKKNSSCKTLHLFGAYTIGKERMYLSVADKYNMKVYVDSRRHRILASLGWPKERMSLLTLNKEEACIWVVPLGDINMKRLPEYFELANNKPFMQQYNRIIGYRPTGWSLGSKPSSSLVTSRYKDNVVIHSVPYSEHSSFPELVECLACLRPQKIVPTVNTGKSDEQVKLLLQALREKQTKLSFSTTLESCQKSTIA